MATAQRRAALSAFAVWTGLSLIGLLLAGAPPARPAGRETGRLPRAGTEPASSAPPPCTRLEGNARQAREALSALARDLAATDPRLARQAEDDLLACTRERSRRLAAKGAWSPAEVEAVAALLLVEPERFVDSPDFRRRILEILPSTLETSAPDRLRDDLLTVLNQVRGFDFAASDLLEAAWGRTPRRAAERALPLPSSPPPGTLLFDADTSGRLAASIYSLPSLFFDAETASRFLSAVRALDPERELIVLADRPLTGALAATAKSAHLRLLETYGRPYTPWPRDPFSLVRSASGRLVALARPNLQPGREEDANLAAELVQNLPADLDRRWGGKEGVAWSTAPTPFHNGQVLLTRDAAWMTIHALEPRVLALLGIERVPVESFATAEGIDRYLAAADRAAGELSALYGRPVRFIHPLPRSGALPERTALLRTLGGAAGYDLDSLVSLVPVKGGTARIAALVADPKLGRELLMQTKPDELASLRAGFALAPEGDALRAALLAAQDAPAPRALTDFLDLAARHLEAEGLRVRRLPLLSVPVSLLSDHASLAHPEFLLSWNNVVVEVRGKTTRAEGFSYLFPLGDHAAQETFTALGVHLDLLPPLTRSIVLNGGYRCASNHLRVEPRLGGRGGGVPARGPRRAAKSPRRWAFFRRP